MPAYAKHTHVSDKAPFRTEPLVLTAILISDYTCGTSIYHQSFHALRVVYTAGRYRQRDCLEPVLVAVMQKMRIATNLHLGQLGARNMHCESMSPFTAFLAEI